VAVTAPLLIAATLLLQRLLGAPGGPYWSGLLLLPAIWVVGPMLLGGGRRWVWIAVAIGLGWDVLLEPIIGPGAIAWSAAAVSLLWLASIVADRSPKAWLGFGAVAAAIVILVHRLALLPLGLPRPVRWIDLALSVAVTALWCGLVGWIRSLNLPKRWRARRARTLR
jgi:hypothetical protein